ncbi:poly(3-hydroxybutyrate) depolymerase [Oxalobacteraceae bacterium OTU3CAMAD1]|nr:poly(3-hydroxybutyrate) depolymerase [Oxalobacteraceae bacterium OTU3CAMAD1]
MVASAGEKIVQLGSYAASKRDNSISGLSSGAFMTVQLHLARSASFSGAGIIAGGPFRCAQTYRSREVVAAEDAYIENSLYICMSPLIPQTAPDPRQLADMTRDTAKAGLIDDVANLADDRLYIFTGSRDEVVYSDVVAKTRKFYEMLGVKPENIAYHDNVPAGHSIITNNPEDSALATNQPPYINNGGFMQSHDILRHIYEGLEPPAERLAGQLVRFDQTEFLGTDAQWTSMSRFGYAYIPSRVLAGAVAAPRVHIALHGCKQGYNYTDYVNGRADTANQPPYGNRYIASTGYNQIAESNDIIVLYPQAEGTDNGEIQNPDGCWDWWGYSSKDAKSLYYSRDAVQIKAIHAMLDRLCA